jgi:hypothetical protein
MEHSFPFVHGAFPGVGCSVTDLALPQNRWQSRLNIKAQPESQFAHPKAQSTPAGILN